MRSSRSLVRVIGLLAGAAVVLAGCGKFEVPLGPGLVSGQADSSGMRVGTCFTGTVTRIVADYQDGNSEPVVFFDASGSLDVRWGESFDLDAIRESMTVSVDEAAPASGVLITVLLYKGESANQGFFDLTDGPMSSTRWRHNDDSETVDVCA